MKKTFVNSLLNKMPIPDELKETIGDNMDITKLIAREVMNQVVSHSSKIKDEFGNILGRELGSYLNRINLQKVLRDTLDEMELDIKITFRKKPREKRNQSGSN